MTPVTELVSVSLGVIVKFDTKLLTSNMDITSLFEASSGIIIISGKTVTGAHTMISVCHAFLPSCWKSIK